MIQGVLESAVLLVNLTHGIFKKERRWVWETEIMTAIKAEKPIILFTQGGKDGFKWDKMPGENVLVECVDGVDPSFQHVARAMVTALEVCDWASNSIDREAKLKKIMLKYKSGASDSKKLARKVESLRLEEPVVPSEIAQAQDDTGAMQEEVDRAKACYPLLIPISPSRNCTLISGLIFAGCIGGCREG